MTNRKNVKMLRAPVDRQHGHLSYLDWKVVEIAHEDGRWSLNPDGLVARLMSGLFGIEVGRALANERLEALRRFAVCAWFSEFIPARETIRFLDAGYSTANARQILEHIAANRGFTPSVQDCLV
jgi:hypothetical protein